VSLTNFLSQRTDATCEAASRIASQVIQSTRRAYIAGNQCVRTLDRKRKFKLGLVLALWPVLFAIVAPAAYSDRLPIAIFCITAILSEAAAALLFFLTYRRPIDRPEDRLTSWSVIGAAAAGLCMVAFLIATVVNVIQVG
jgi:hypothetical protein